MKDTFFPDRVRTLREAAQLTQKQLAGHLGVSTNTVARWEMGRCQPSYYALGRLALVLHVGVETLFPAP